MATMYENLCGNCGWDRVDRVDICMTFHMRAFDFFYTIDLTIFKIARLLIVI
jgi:hypothetical protein